ncbi:MAG: AMP-binding protein, partial [Solirubrobacterales bacterium]
MPVRSIAGKLPIGSFARRVSLGPLGNLDDAAFNVRVLAEAGVIRAVRPDRFARGVRQLVRWGTSPAGGIATAAIGHPDEPAIEDEAGSLTFADLHGRSNALARGLRSTGIRAGDSVAVMCRNHRGFIEATVACSKLGANVLYLNTAFAAPQLADVVEREDPVALIHDGEFAALLAEAGRDVWRIVAWEEGGGGPEDAALEGLIRATARSLMLRRAECCSFVFLSSGSCVSPKGAVGVQPVCVG